MATAIAPNDDERGSTHQKPPPPPPPPLRRPKPPPSRRVSKPPERWQQQQGLEICPGYVHPPGFTTPPISSFTVLRHLPPIFDLLPLEWQEQRRRDHQINDRHNISLIRQPSAYETISEKDILCYSMFTHQVLQHLHTHFHGFTPFTAHFRLLPPFSTSFHSFSPIKLNKKP
jgi:hypothetical protein